ncbi:MAG: cobyrinate a,c-diamide synthase [Sphingobacteriia bacterium]|nr:cobyrinate a,c-diamide synthase [Sphingobacteriia bacterium]NCC37815.1 cobyrinate a,c-diamide synthase [Gammaproteobacteria bacterium]
MAHLYLSATQKSSGKTTVSIGLCRVLRDRGLRVQPFKKGPDYIDPLWLSEAAGHACYNLDFHTMERAEILASFADELASADLGLIEGNVGLFDSVDPKGSNSNAELAKLLGSPVILVINCQGLGRGIAPLIRGFQTFDPELRLGGLILNKVGGARHAKNLLAVLDHYIDLPVLGVIHRDEQMAIAERHLGLMPSNETGTSQDWIERIAARIAEQVDVTRLLEIAESASRPRSPTEPRRVPPPAGGAIVRIGVARDAAFGFYYPDDLRALVAAGAELVPFSPIADAAPPEVDALFIGGGFPEYRMRELEANRSMRQAIADAIGRGLPVYAECGGLMYLCRGLTWEGERRAMVGVIDAEVEMRERPQGRGYVRLRETADFPWARVGTGMGEIAGHEFHHSAIVAPNPAWRYAYEVLRGAGIDGAHDGIVQGRLLACYSHLRAVGGCDWTHRFVESVRHSLGA